MKFVLEQQGPVVPAAVYLFQRRDRRRFKVGSSVDPVARAAQLPEFKAGLLDLPKSLALWLPTPMRAHQVERSLHRGLAPYRVPADHQGDGHTEWFAPAALLPAMRLLGQMPSGERGGGTLPIRPVEAPATAFAEVAVGDREPQDVWWGVEDLWLRLGTCLPMKLERKDRQTFVVVEGFRDKRDGPVAALRMHAFDPDTYTWHRGGRKGSFVEWIDFRGPDLVFLMTPAAAMNRWPDGRDLSWQVLNMVGRLPR